MGTEERPRCPHCGSGNVMYRKSDDHLWCRRCGEEWPRVVPQGVPEPQPQDVTQANKEP